METKLRPLLTLRKGLALFFALISVALLGVLPASASAHEIGFDRAFGVDVDPGGGAGFESCTTASGCQAGTLSGAAGGMSLPSGVATDAQGRSWSATSPTIASTASRWLATAPSPSTAPSGSGSTPAARV